MSDGGTVAADSATTLERPSDTASEFQALQAMLLSRLLTVQTATLVQVQAVHGGGLSTPVTVDVLPLVEIVDGAFRAVPQETLYGRPALRLQGGGNAVIVDPKKDDIGLMVFASRDISAVLASRQPGPAPSGRFFDYADGVYIGVAWPQAGTPSQYLAFLVGITLGAAITSTTGNLSVATGATGSFTAAGGETVDVQDGIITGIF